MGNHDGPENIDPEIRGRDHGMLRTKMDQVKRQETTTRKFHTKGSRITPRPAVRGPRLWPSANSFFDALGLVRWRPAVGLPEVLSNMPGRQDSAYEWGTEENVEMDFSVRPTLPAHPLHPIDVQQSRTRHSPIDQRHLPTAVGTATCDL